MFIGHLPAGYLASRALMRTRDRDIQLMIWVGCACAVLPDLDLIYFYLVDARQHAHHTYWTHIPAFWLALYLTVRVLSARSAWLWPYLTIGVVNVLLHLALDSIAAEILWLYPWSDVRVNLVAVPARYDWWVWSFVLHWTFALELAVTGAALVVLLRSRRPRTVGASSDAIAPD